MPWVYGHYEYFNSVSADQMLPYKDNPHAERVKFVLMN